MPRATITAGQALRRMQQLQAAQSAVVSTAVEEVSVAVDAVATDLGAIDVDAIETQLANLDSRVTALEP